MAPQHTLKNMGDQTTATVVIISIKTIAYDTSIVLYTPKERCLEMPLLELKDIAYSTDTPIRAALYRTYNGKYELLAHRIMRPGEKWEIGFFDIVTTPIISCTNIYSLPYPFSYQLNSM